MTDQVDMKQVTWQDLEVAEEHCQGCFDPQCGIEVAEEDLPKGVLILQGIDERAWNEFVRRYGSSFGILCAPHRDALTARAEELLS